MNSEKERNERILAAMKAESQKAISRNEARELLIKQGIFTADGELHEDFGGKPKTDKP